MKDNKVRNMCYMALFTALICVISQIPGIPMPGGVPMTLQTLIIPMAGIILGKWWGTGATLLYLLLGMVGLPVFSGFSGGIGVLAGATGGFLISFPLMPLTAGLGYEIGRKQTGRIAGQIYLYCGLIAGAVLNYLVGTLWFAGVFLGGINSENLAAGFTACVLPFIPTAIVKLILAGLLGSMIHDRLASAGLLNSLGKKVEKA